MVKRGEDMKLFARYNNDRSFFHTKFYLVFFGVMFFATIGDEKVFFNPKMLLIPAAVIAVFLTRRFLDTCGLCIEDDKIYFRVVFKFKVKMEKINAIKFEKSLKAYYSSRGRTTYSVLEDAYGNPYYTMIFLSEVVDGMEEFCEGDVHFKGKFWRKVRFSTAYEPKVVEWFVQRKPDLALMYPPDEE